MTIKLTQQRVDRGRTESLSDVLGGNTSTIVTFSVAQLSALNTYLAKIQAGATTTTVETAINALP
jgi:hypothetical protein